MITEQPGAAGATEVADFGFVGGFAPAPIVADEQPSEETPNEETPAEEPAKEQEQPKVEEPKGGLADLIRAQREARAAKEQEAKQREAAQSEAEGLKTELEKLKRSLAEFEADPVAYAKAAKWSPEKQAYLAQMLLYDLAPDKATPLIRQRLFESKQALREKEKAAREEQERAERAKAEDQAQYNSYVSMVQQAVDSFESGSYPESEAWFGEDRATYEQSLLVTARNLAVSGKRTGQAVDLSPANLAKVLEADIAKRMGARDARRGVRQPAGGQGQQKVQVTGGKQPVDESTKGLSQAGAPRAKAKTDQERVARAVEAAFKSPGTR